MQTLSRLVLRRNYSESVDILMKEDIFCEESGMTQAAGKSSQKRIIQKGQIKRGRAGSTVTENNFLESMCEGTSCQQLGCTGAEQLKQRKVSG